MKPRLIEENGWPFFVVCVIVTVGPISEEGMTSKTGLLGLAAVVLLGMSLALRSDWFEIPAWVAIALMTPDFLRGSWVPHPIALVLSAILLVLAAYRSRQLLMSRTSGTRPGV